MLSMELPMQKWETILELINGAEEEERKGNNTHGAPSNPT